MKKYDVYSMVGIKLITVTASSVDTAKNLVKMMYPYLDFGYIMKI